MRLFSEKVEPTFTSSNLNIITVENFTEVFFDVYELEINGKKFIAEKVSDYKGKPVVNIPLVEGNKKYLAPFVLSKGKFEILFNKDNVEYIEEAVSSNEAELDLTEEPREEIENIVLEKKETILKEIDQARQSAKKYAEEIKQQKIAEATSEIRDQKVELAKAVSASKKEFLSEFLQLTENIKNEFYSFNEHESIKLREFVEESVDVLSDKLHQDILQQKENAQKAFLESVDELTSKVLSGVLLKLEEKTSDQNNNIDKRYKDILTEVNKAVKQSVKDVEINVNSTLKVLEQSNIELNNAIQKSSSKALSRIGNVKSQLEEELSRSVSKIKAYYDDRIKIVEDQIVDLSDETRTKFLQLISESKESLLRQIDEIKIDNEKGIIVERNGTTRKEINLRTIKSDLERTITQRFTNEISSLKRLIELSSGGGSVAKQFAAGGTMNGDLTVTGSISASNYLGVMSSISGAYLSLSGGTITGNLVVEGSLSASNYLGLANSLSGNYLSLSGGTIDGNLVVEGSLSASNYLGLADSLSAYYLSLSGGTVQGDLTIAGSLSAANYLGLIEFLSGSYLALTGGTVTGDLTVTNTISTNTLSTTYLYTTILEAQSANITVIDIKQYELSGFNVTGNATVQGSISSTQVVYASGGNSNIWNVTHSTVQSNSGNWSSVYSSYNSTSADLVSGGTSPSQGTVRLNQLDGTTIDIDTGLQTNDNPIFASVSATGNVYGNNITDIEERVSGLYTYLVQNFDHNYIARSVNLSSFVGTEWSPSLGLNPGDTVTLSAANTVYILGNSDGSSVNDYFVINLKPNYLFYKANIPDYGILDTFPLSAVKSSKYVIQVEFDNDLHFCEVNVVSNGVIATATEYGSNYTTNDPFVEFGASINSSGIVILSAIALAGTMTNFIFKGNRTNFF